MFVTWSTSSDMGFGQFPMCGGWLFSSRDLLHVVEVGAAANYSSPKPVSTGLHVGLLGSCYCKDPELGTVQSRSQSWIMHQALSVHDVNPA